MYDEKNGYAYAVCLKKDNIPIREVINSGYSVWKWTYSGEESYVGMLYGFSGLTMNNVGGMAGSVRRIIAPETITDEEISTNKFHSVTAEYYGIENMGVDGVTNVMSTTTKSSGIDSKIYDLILISDKYFLVR